jgi:hypothetical protein
MRAGHLSRAVEPEDTRKAAVVEPVLTGQNRSDSGVDGASRCIWVLWRLVYGLCRYQYTFDIRQTVRRAGFIAAEIDGGKQFTNSLASRRWGLVRRHEDRFEHKR